MDFDVLYQQFNIDLEKVGDTIKTNILKESDPSKVNGLYLYVRRYIIVWSSGGDMYDNITPCDIYYNIVEYELYY